ncbi:hypothetical protein K504DRAFT_211324 [Pleomassaria siparia CBS 279.74]|uniref:GmrSD restriction endonucleases N-terminal domain-containing protein n=1 Tax=Pleomassaria siparia CBS 279.74 TaxID=1314801 RepID=A0A6G1KIR7_9PLEO|nr:hypothetical protein K504DRAFT_211324 [Pleomassaria siparia CBS 279.74]
MVSPQQPNQTQSFLKHEEEDGDDFYVEELSEDDDHFAYKPRRQLSEPSVVKRPLHWLIKHLDSGYINVEPEYQRDVVWTADRMSGLVNSLMESYYIPPIILSKHSEEGNRHTLVCVDGKQRLSSVQAFIKGLIPCNDYRGEKWWFCDNSVGGRRKLLPESIQKQFLNKEFVSFEFTSLSAEQEEDLFARVQMGVQLSPAEKMRASTGPWQELARLYKDDFPMVFSLLKDRSRAKDFQMALSCFSQIIEVQHPSGANGVPKLKTTHANLPKLLKNQEAVDDEIKSHLASVFTTFNDLLQEDPNVFTNSDKRLRGVQTFAPVEMVAVAVLISIYSETRNNRLLLGDISALRESLREHFVDLRMNHSVWVFIWEYIDNLERIRGTIDGTTIHRDVERVRTISTSTPVVQPSSGVKKGRPSARTKQVTVTPGDQQATAEPRYRSTHVPTPTPAPILAVVKLEEASLSSRKRQRVEQTPGDNTKRPTPPQSRAGSSTSDPMILDDIPAPLPHKRPTAPSAIPPSASAPKIQKARKSNAPAPIIGENAQVLGGRRLLGGAELARQQRIAALHNHRAPSTPMAPPSTSTTSIAGNTPMAIDLTDDDNEQERQSLLSQFSASKKPKEQTKIRNPTMKNLPPNPYAKNKKIVPEVGPRRS